MKVIFALVRKEMKVYFNTPIAYVILTFFLVLINWFFFRSFFLDGVLELRGFFFGQPWFFLFLIPAITMKSWAEEKKSGTMEVLLTLPISDWETVLGKFLGCFLFFSINILLTLTLPLTMNYLGAPDNGVIFAGYLGLFLMGGSYIAIGLFISSITENQIIAFVVGVMAMFSLTIIGNNVVLFSVPDFMVPIFKYVSLATHFDSINHGVLDSRDIIYYISIIFFFLFLNVRILESRKF